MTGKEFQLHAPEHSGYAHLGYHCQDLWLAVVSKDAAQCLLVLWRPKHDTLS